MGIRVSDTATVRIEENALRDLNNLDYTDGGYGIGLENVLTATVTDNRVAGTQASLDEFGYTREADEITSSNNELVLDGDSVPARLVSRSE